MSVAQIEAHLEAETSGMHLQEQRDYFRAELVALMSESRLPGDVDPLRHRVTGERSTKVWRMLWDHRGSVVSKGRLLALFTEHKNPCADLKVSKHRLSQKLDGSGWQIAHVRGRGYRLERV